MSDEADIRPRLRVMQIIAVMLVLGPAAFLCFAIVAVANRGGEAMGGRPPIITWMAIGMVPLMAVIGSILGPRMSQAGVRRIALGNWQPAPGSNPEHFGTDTAKLLAVRQTEMLIVLAMLEGAAFLACIAYFLEAQPLALVAAGVAIALKLVRFPTEQRVRAWLDWQSERLAEMRNQDGSRVR